MHITSCVRYFIRANIYNLYNDLCGGPRGGLHTCLYGEAITEVPGRVNVELFGTVSGLCICGTDAVSALVTYSGIGATNVV